MRGSRKKDIYQNKLRENPYNTDALADLGALYAIHGELTDAQACFERLRRLRPRDGSVYFSLGTIYEDLEDLKFGNSLAAELCYELATEMTPPYIDAYFNHALLLQRKERWMEALTKWDAYLRHDPNSRTAKRNRAFVKKKLVT